MASPLFALLITLFGITVAILLLIFVLVPVCKGIGWAVASIINGIGYLIRHVFEFVFGMIGDVLRFVGAILASVLLAPLAVLNVVIGRWSAAGHFASSVKREIGVGTKCIYRVALKRPLRLLFLDSILEGVEQRVPEAMAAAPGSDKPGKRTGQFEGYTIVGSLKGGGSGAKLYVAIPDADVLTRYRDMPPRVVIKAFALAEGSTLPQILRESRALECAKQLGLVFEHGMDDRRFYYVMPFHDGDHLAIVTRQLHGESDGGLSGRALDKALSYVRDLVATLETYHRGGLWHKDVKPENVIVHDGRANLVDLGLVTPLRSAMTLTTHGTEYFRDPELVRQALRGVKVHQVNGAKFDVYAAGAVLYFMIENDFPAHGALSRFSRRSPESLKWIVPRAMADYNHRYATAQQMLDDIDHVMRARDPFAVKPAALPSMGAQASAEPIDEPDFEPAFAGQATVSRVTPMAGSPIPPAATQPDSRTATLEGRPDIHVTNWWTGAYGVTAGAAPAIAAVVDEVAEACADVERKVAAELRHVSGDLQSKVRCGRISKRRAARAQVRSAKARARDMRRRATDHRRLVRRERRPSVMLGLIILAFLVVFGGAVAIVATDMDRGNRRHSPVVITETASEVWGMAARGDSGVVAGLQGRYLVLNEHPAKTDIDVELEIGARLGRYEKSGIELSYDNDATTEILYAAGPRAPGELDLALVETVLEQHELDGVLIVFAPEGEGAISERIEIAELQK